MKWLILVQQSFGYYFLATRQQNQILGREGAEPSEAAQASTQQDEVNLVHTKADFSLTASEIAFVF